MKLVLKNVDGESVTISVKAGDTFSDLKTRIAAENGLEIDIEEFIIKEQPIKGHYNVIEYFHGKNEVLFEGEPEWKAAGSSANEIQELSEEETEVETAGCSANEIQDIRGDSNATGGSSICRLCAGSKSVTVLVPITQVMDKITTCLPIKVDLTDGLSKLVCQTCIEKLNTFKDFIDRCVEAQKTQLHMQAQKSGCPICAKNNSHETSLSTPEFFEALEQHNAVCLQADGAGREDEDIFVFCSVCQKNVTLMACLQATCHEDDVFCCFMCAATLESSHELREHLKDHLSETSRTKMWKCSTCKLEFTDMVLLEHHLESHRETAAEKGAGSSKQGARCDICQKLFRCQARLDFHMKFHEVGALAGQCTECRKEFPSESCLYKHMVYNHLNPQVFTCQHCGRMFRNKSSLTYHYRCHTSLEAMRPFTCDICKKRFARKNILRDHMTNWHGETTSVQPLSAFQCPACKEVFPNTTSAISHMEIHHTEQERTGESGESGFSFNMLPVFKLFACELCDKCYPIPSIVMEHRLGHGGKYQCKVCNHEFLHYPDLRAHVDNHASDGIADYKADFRVPILFVCEFCEKCFKSYQMFKTHSNSHLEGDASPYLCQFCTEKFDSYDAALRHRTSHSQGSDAPRATNTLKPFECHHCHKSFTSGSALTKHVRVHSGEKPFKCHLCSKRFTQSSGLITHLKVHSEERPYQCDLCDRSYKIIGDYKKHVRKHSGVRAYKCDFCTKTFITRPACSQHMKRHKPVIRGPHSCDLCDESFHTSNSLELHKLKHKTMQNLVISS